MLEIEAAWPTSEPKAAADGFSGRLEITTMGLDIAKSVFQVHGMTI
jgi:hypothetical protein